MLKRTLFFESPGYINLSDKQLCFSPRLPRGDQSTKREYITSQKKSNHNVSPEISRLL